MRRRYNAISDYLIKTIYTDWTRMEGYRRLTGNLALRTNQPGAWVISGSFEACERAIADLRRRERAGYLTPKKLERFFRQWATFMYVPRTHFALMLRAGVTRFAGLVRRIDAYNPQTDIVMWNELSYGTDDDVFFNASVLTVASADTAEALSEETASIVTGQAPLSGQQLFEAFEQMGAGDYAHFLKNQDLDDFDRNDPHIAEAGEKLLSSDNRHCLVCDTVTRSRCKRCRLTYYCSAACQRADWSAHKKVCGVLALHGQLLEQMASGV